MNKADCFNLGHVAKLHGYKGEVSLFFDTNHSEDFQDIDFVFIEIDGKLIPFFIETISPINAKGFATVRFEGLDSEDEARRLLKKQMYLPLEVLPKLTGNDFYDHEVIGFTVFDESYGKVGELAQIIDYAANPLFQIMNKELDKEVLIPLNKELITKLDRELKEIHLIAPSGLIEMYLED